MKNFNKTEPSSPTRRGEFWRTKFTSLGNDDMM